jgi:heterodisulfide reductase subunit C2
MSTNHDHAATKSFARELADATGIRASQCYQCGKCTAGCPMVPDMDLTPSQVMRSIQVDRRDEVLGSKTIWYCASCLTCSTRCPQEVKIAELMDALRERSLREGKAHRAARKIRAFTTAFLNGIKKKGRLHEMAMAISYKLRSRDFFSDLLLAPRMFLKGKLKLFAKPVKARADVERVFDETRDAP